MGACFGSEFGVGSALPTLEVLFDPVLRAVLSAGRPGVSRLFGISADAALIVDDAVRLMCHHRILARFKRPAATLAVLADARPNWRPAPYAADLWGCRVRFEYPACKLLDFGSALLESDPNPVATVIAAHLAVHRTRSSMEGRKRFKRELTWRLYQRGWSRPDIVQLFRLIDWLLRLPDELEAEFRQELMRFEEEHDMPYITSIERLGREEGRQEGRWEGRKEGRLEGQHEATANLLVRQSRKRFPEFTVQDETAIRQLPLASLESLGEAFLDFTSIEELRRWLARSLRA